MEKYCKKCGHKLKDNVKFCSICGTAVGQNGNVIQYANAQMWEEIYNATYAKAYAVAIQIVKNKEDALDILQESYIAAFRNLHTLRDPSKAGAWINQIVANRCKDWLRKKNPMLFSDFQTEDADFEFESGIANEYREFMPEATADYKETKRIMQGILDQLSEDQRLCILMYYYDEMSVGEIAQALECSNGTVKSRLNYARKYIKSQVEALERRGTKLYGIAPLPFIIWMLRSKENTLEVQAAKGTLKSRIQSKVATQGVKLVSETTASSGKPLVSTGAVKETGRKSVSSEIVKGTAKGASGTGKKALAAKIVAGITAFALATSSGCLVYSRVAPVNNAKQTTAVGKPADSSKNTKVKKTDTDKVKPEAEKLPKFSLTQSQIDQIEFAAANFYAAEIDAEQKQKNHDFTLDVRKGKINEMVMSSAASAVAYNDDSIEAEDKVEGQKFIRFEVCKEFLKDSFEYEIKDWEELRSVFSTAGYAETEIFRVFYMKDDKEDLCKIKRCVQTGKDEYHFYVQVGENDGVMNITAHRNDKSKIGGFVFDKIVYKTGKMDSVAGSVENAIMNMARGKAEINLRDNESYDPSGSYDVNKLTDKELIHYANLFIGWTESTSGLIKTKEVLSKDGVLEANILKLSDYKDICKYTLGRTKKFSIVQSQEMKVKGDKAEFIGYVQDALYLVEDLTCVESLDGSMKVTGTMQGIEAEKYNVKAQAHRDSKSKTGVVTTTMQISKK